MSLKPKHLNIILLTLVILAPIFVFASDNVLEAGIPGQVAPGDPLPGLTDYMRYIYWFLLGTVGIAAFVSLVWYGVLWIYSGIVEQKSEALEGIKNTFLGLVFAFSAYIILYTINPDLVSLRAPAAPIPTVNLSDKTPNASVTVTQTAPLSKESIQTLAKDILNSPYLSGSLTASWSQCATLIKGTKAGIPVTPKKTIEEVIVSSYGSASACQTGCSLVDMQNFCASIVAISPNMMQALSQIARTPYAADSDFKPSFQIIEITGGNRPSNNKVKKHYDGEAVDVMTPRPSFEQTYPLEYKKIVSAFTGTAAGAKATISCVDKNEDTVFATFSAKSADADFTPCNPAENSLVDHLHIEW